MKIVITKSNEEEYVFETAIVSNPAYYQHLLICSKDTEGRITQAQAVERSSSKALFRIVGGDGEWYSCFDLLILSSSLEGKVGILSVDTSTFVHFLTKYSGGQ